MGSLQKKNLNEKIRNKYYEEEHLIIDCVKKTKTETLSTYSGGICKKDRNKKKKKVNR
jgi:hypothetical protein